MSFVRTTLFRALKKPNGQVVCLDPEFIAYTTKVVANDIDYVTAKNHGWKDGPQEAMDAFEAAEQVVSNEATYRAAKDQTMSEPAQKEAQDYEASTPLHTPEIPQQVRRPRGRPKKSVA